MYKLVTGDSSAYALSILPFEGTVEKRGVQKKVICLAFGAEIDTLAKVKEICTDELKMATVTVYEDSIQVRELKDYTILEQITTATVTVDGKDVEVLMAKMSKSTTIPEQIGALEDQVKSLETAKTNLEGLNKDLSERVGTLQSENKNLGEKVTILEKSNKELTESLTVVNALRETTSSNTNDITVIKAKLGDVNEDELGLEDLKEYRVAKSKLNLAAYLEATKITSTAHQGVAAEYSITQEKQSQLMAVIMMCTLNPSYQPSWNAAGAVCTYDWTIDELQLLAADIEAFVRPLVSIQQTMEVEIMSAATIEDVKAISIEFGDAVVEEPVEEETPVEGSEE